jgi:hypothetical protein
MDTCEVTFYETTPSPSPVFEPAGPDNMGKTIFVEDEHTDADWGDPEITPLVVPVEPAPLLRLIDLAPLLPSLGVCLSHCLLRLEELRLLLKERPPLRGWLRDMFGVITLLYRSLMRLMSESLAPHISRCPILFTQLLSHLLSPRMLDKLCVILNGSMLCMRSSKNLRGIGFGSWCHVLQTAIP